MRSQKFNTYSRRRPQRRLLHPSTGPLKCKTWREEWFFWRRVEGVSGLRGAGKGMSKQTLGPEWWDTGNGNRTPCPCSHVNTAMWITTVRASEDPGDNGRRLSAESQALFSIAVFVSVLVGFFCVFFRSWIKSLEKDLNRSAVNLYPSSRLFPSWSHMEVDTVKSQCITED